MMRCLYTAQTKIITKYGEELYTLKQMGFKSLQQRIYLWKFHSSKLWIFSKWFFQIKATQSTNRCCIIANSALAIRVICPTKDIETCKQRGYQISLRVEKAASAFAMFCHVIKCRCMNILDEIIAENAKK